MKKVIRFGVSMSPDLLKDFDRLIKKKGYASRSEAVRDIVREHLVEYIWESEDKETVGTITMVYSHEVRELMETLTDLQHHYHTLIISTMHVHLDRHNCLEVVVVKGKGSGIKRIAERLISTKGVKHGRLTMTTTGKELA